MEATAGSRASSRGAGLDLRKVKEVSRNFVFHYTAFAFVPALPIPHNPLQTNILMNVNPLHCLACSTGASGDQGVEGETGEAGPAWKELERFSAFASF